MTIMKGTLAHSRSSRIYLILFAMLLGVAAVEFAIMLKVNSRLLHSVVDALQVVVFIFLTKRMLASKPPRPNVAIGFGVFAGAFVVLFLFSIFQLAFQ